MSTFSVTLSTLLLASIYHKFAFADVFSIIDEARDFASTVTYMAITGKSYTGDSRYDTCTYNYNDAMLDLEEAEAYAGNPKNYGQIVKLVNGKIRNDVKDCMIAFSGNAPDPEPAHPNYFKYYNNKFMEYLDAIVRAV